MHTESDKEHSALIMNIKRVIVLLTLCCFLLYSGNKAVAGETKPESKTVDIKLLDLELVDQDGRKVRFKSDVLGDRVAAIIPFYTTCTTAYPILIFIFTRLQDMLGERLGREVVLISVSVDPRTDIPIRLKAFANRQKAKPGWIFLSGDMNNLSRVLQGIGVQYIVGQSVDEHQHIPLTMIGDAGGEWKRFYGYPSPEILMTQINKSISLKKGKK